MTGWAATTVCALLSPCWKGLVIGVSFGPMLGHLGSYRLTFLFWLGVTWLGYVYVIYPFILLILALLHRVRPVMRDDFLPTVSVLISAHNEERDIGWKVNETLRWEYPPDRLEVLVASDASEDRTDEIVRAIKNPRLTFVRMESRGGKGAALNRLARSARGELLFFTDANAHIEAHCLRRMARHFADERVGCVTGMTSAEPQSDRVIGSGDRLYLGYETAISHLESQRGSVLVCDGAVFCIRRSLFRPVSPDLANDLELPMRIGYAGYWVLQEPAAKAIENETNSPREEFTRRRRICAQGILAMWRLRQTLRGLRGWQFVSHKFLRWLTLIPLLCLLVSSAPLKGGPVFHLLLWLQSLFYLFALAGLLLTLAGRRANRLMSGPLFILLGSAGALAGVVDACLGRRFAVWEIPKLSRGRIG